MDNRAVEGPVGDVASVHSGYADLRDVLPLDGVSFLAAAVHALDVVTLSFPGVAADFQAGMDAGRDEGNA